MNDTTALIERIHATPHKSVIAVAGAGSQALAWLLGVAGASNTLLETLVPYGRLSMIDFLGSEPEQYVSEETARSMARAAYRSALTLREDESPAVGLACTATLVTNRPKRGDHRCFIAAWDRSQVWLSDLILEKGARDRPGEEDLCSRMVVNLLARASGIEDVLPLELTAAESPRYSTVAHPSPIGQLLAGEVSHVVVHPDGAMAPEEGFKGVLFPGSYQPLHRGHTELAETASRMTGQPVAYEISVFNVDKPPLEETEIMARLEQFRGSGTVALTSQPTFHGKARLFPGASFVIGWDTAIRIVHPRYYGGSEEAMLGALADMWSWGSRFLVAGRAQDGAFHGLGDVPIPAGFAPLFREIPESDFRVDISSTELRAQAGA